MNQGGLRCKAKAKRLATYLGFALRQEFTQGGQRGQVEYVMDRLEIWAKVDGIAAETKHSNGRLNYDTKTLNQQLDSTTDTNSTMRK